MSEGRFPLTGLVGGQVEQITYVPLICLFVIVRGCVAKSEDVWPARKPTLREKLSKSVGPWKKTTSQNNINSERKKSQVQTFLIIRERMFLNSRRKYSPCSFLR